MAFEEGHKNIPEDLISDYSLDGKKVSVSGKTGHPVKYRNPAFVSQEKKVEAAALYCVLGDVATVAKKTHLTEKQIRAFKEEVWWAEIQKKIMVEQNEGLLAKVNSTIDDALLELADRIEHGDKKVIPAQDEVLNKDGSVKYPATKEITLRTPVKGRDLAQIFHALTHQRNLMRGEPTTITSASSTEQKLALLQKHFRDFSQGIVVEGTATEVIEEDGSNS
jgi:hypothetical protein